MILPNRKNRSADLPVSMTFEQYQEAEENMDGICLVCCTFTDGDTEPDAEEYPCEECGCNAVQGIQNAVIEGNIQIVKD